MNKELNEEQTDGLQLLQFLAHIHTEFVKNKNKDSLKNYPVYVFCDDGICRKVSNIQYFYLQAEGQHEEQDPKFIHGKGFYLNGYDAKGEESRMSIDIIDYESDANFCEICCARKIAPPEYPNDTVCCCKGLQPYGMSNYPGEYKLVKTHPANGGEQWYKRAEVDAKLEELEELKKKIVN